MLCSLQGPKLTLAFSQVTAVHTTYCDSSIMLGKNMKAKKYSSTNQRSETILIPIYCSPAISSQSTCPIDSASRTHRSDGWDIIYRMCYPRAHYTSKISVSKGDNTASRTESQALRQPMTLIESKGYVVDMKSLNSCVLESAIVIYLDSMIFCFLWTRMNLSQCSCISLLRVRRSSELRQVIALSW